MTTRADASDAVPQTPTWRDWALLLRPRQWVKNTFVLTPLLFSGRGLDPAAIMEAVVAFTLFCLLASGVYAWNDVLDRVADRAHPVKRWRPVAAGRIGGQAALFLAGGLAALALGVAAAIRPQLLWIAGAYLLLNVFYTLRLKRVVILDVFCVAAFFVLRLLAGTAAIAVEPSIWLLLCGGLLALYLGFAKRRHELLLLGGDSAQHRSVLSQYSPGFLDQASTILLSVTIVSYLMYTVSKYNELGSYLLSWSAVFVFYGVFRYIYLVHRSEGGDPTEALLTDRMLLADVLLWILFCGWVIYKPV